MRSSAVVEARLRLAREIDPAVVGAMVTKELCGHWEHEGPCRWPHNNEIRPDGDAHVFRTLFVGDPADMDEVRRRIDRALGENDGWVVLTLRRRDPAEPELELARALAAIPAKRS